MVWKWSKTLFIWTTSELWDVVRKWKFTWRFDSHWSFTLCHVARNFLRFNWNFLDKVFTPTEAHFPQFQQSSSKARVEYDALRRFWSFVIWSLIFDFLKYPREKANLMTKTKTGRQQKSKALSSRSALFLLFLVTRYHLKRVLDSCWQLQMFWCFTISLLKRCFDLVLPLKTTKSRSK